MLAEFFLAASIQGKNLYDLISYVQIYPDTTEIAPRNKMKNN